MLQLNKVLLAGQLTDTPKLRYTSSGTAVTEFVVECERVNRGPKGEKRSEMAPVTVIVWGKVAEACVEHLEAGSHVLVDGYLKLREWDSRDGQHHRSLDVTATFVQFMTYKHESKTPKPEFHVEEAPA